MSELSARSDDEHAIRAACQAGTFDRALELAIARYGAELMSFLVAILRDVHDADDAFGETVEGLWRALPTFRWDCSLRTFAYTIARRMFVKQKRGPRARRPHVAISAAIDELAAGVRSQTASFLQTAAKDKLAAVRAQLAPEDQALLILRVNRQLAWRDIAQILAEESGSADTVDLTKAAAALRKRFERLKAELRDQLDA